jgi:hypothetical protein
MRIASRRNQADGAGELPRIVALARSGTIASFLRRPMGERRPPRRLQAVIDVPAHSRIVLRSPNPR